MFVCLSDFLSFPLYECCHSCKRMNKCTIFFIQLILECKYELTIETIFRSILLPIKITLLNKMYLLMYIFYIVSKRVIDYIDYMTFI